MDYVNKVLISLTDNYGFEFGKNYKVVSDNGRELEFENGQRFFKDRIDLHFGKNYSELFAMLFCVGHLELAKSRLLLQVQIVCLNFGNWKCNKCVHALQFI
jgi:hypothetical protein